MSIHRFKNAGSHIPIGTTDTDIYVCPEDVQVTIHSLILTNIDDTNPVTATVSVYDTDKASTATIILDTSIAVNSTFTWVTPINLESGDILQIRADDVDNVSAFVSLLEIE